MIGHIQGKVLFSDGNEVIILTNSGIGYQIYYGGVIAEGHQYSLYISHVIRETSQDLFGFDTLKDKKLFELLLTVSGVGPKGAYSLVNTLGATQLLSAVEAEDKKVLSKPKGIGMKAASQIILDLKNKANRIHMFSDRYRVEVSNQQELEISYSTEISNSNLRNLDQKSDGKDIDMSLLLNEALMACTELGFKEDLILPLAQKILNEQSIERSEQLVHLVLKGM